MGKITLYHASPNEILIPTYGKEDEKHDHSKGVYRTPDIGLAREWAVCNDTEVHFQGHVSAFQCAA